MIQYLVDSTAVWRLLRNDALAEEWAVDVESGVVASCAPQRTEFRRSARSAAEFDEMTEMFTDLYPDVGVPKRAWAWIDAAQRRLAALGHHQALSVVDWLVCATAAHHDLVVVHDDKDFQAAGRILADVREYRVDPKGPPGQR